MKWVLYLISFVWIAAGCCLVLYTNESRQRMQSVIRRLDRRFLAFLPGIMGVLLLISASSSRNSGFIVFLGILAIAKGGFIYANPKGHCDRITNWYLDAATDETYRFFGIILLIVGTAVLSWIL